MQDEDAAVLGIGLIIVVVIFILAVIAGFVNAIKGFMLSIGLPSEVVAQFGSILFFGILLGIIILVIQGIVE